MTIASEITRINTNIANAYTACNNKGATMPATQNSANLATCVSSIPTATEPTLASLTITPSTTAQTLTPPSGTDGYNTVTVSAVTASIDSDIVAENIKSGVNILGVAGTVTALAGETRTVSITSTSGNTFTPSSGKNGITSIKCNPTNKALTITPSKTSQTKTVPSGYSGYGTVTCNAVTSSIDSNITAGNIKSGVSILGVTGTYEGSGGGGGIPYTGSVDANKLNYIIRAESGVLTFEEWTDTSDTSYPINGTLVAEGNFDYSSSPIIFACVNGDVELDVESFSVCFLGTSIQRFEYKSNISTIPQWCFSEAFSGCTSLSEVDFSGIIAAGRLAFYGAFYECTSLSSVVFENLNNIATSLVFDGAFEDSSISVLSFPALNSQSFGSYGNQFRDMLLGVTGCTVHFPSNLQSVIGSLSDVTSGFGGTNTTVLFDLQATT